jgi:type VI secretion system protein ImpH
MADDPGPTPHHLTWLDELERGPEEFDFHGVLRRLECMFRDLPRFGEAMRPGDEPLRIGQEPSTAFASSALRAFRRPEDGLPGRLLVSFLGMFGPRGSLPLHLTEYARDRLRNSGDRTLVSFIDLFHHRMLLLFHRAWSRAQPTASHDRRKESRFSLYVGSTFGLALSALRERDAIPDRAKLQYAAWLSAPAPNAAGLEAIVGDYFGLQVAVEEFVGEWLDLPDGGRWRLGESRETSSLGRSSVLGARVWQCDHKFRLVLGPLRRDTFQRMLPGGPSLEKLVGLVQAYVGDVLNWDVRLMLHPGESEQLELARGSRLGWNARLGSRIPAHREDLIVNPFLRQTKRTRSKAAA